MRTDDYYEREALANGATAVRGGTWRCWHRWTLDEVEGVWRYRACGKCGRRKLSRAVFGVIGPTDWGWLETGRRTPPPTAADLMRSAARFGLTLTHPRQAPPRTGPESLHWPNRWGDPRDDEAVDNERRRRGVRS